MSPFPDGADFVKAGRAASLLGLLTILLNFALYGGIVYLLYLAVTFGIRHFS